MKKLENQLLHCALIRWMGIGLITVGVFVAGWTSQSWAQQIDSRSGKLRRAVLPKPAHTTIDPDRAQFEVIVLKFREGTQIRWRGDHWAVNSANFSTEDEWLLERANLDRPQVEVQLATINNYVAVNTKLWVDRVFSRPEPELEGEKRQGERDSQEELADLNLYYFLLLNDASPAEAEALIDGLNTLEIVELAYPQPRYSLPQAGGFVDTPGGTPDMVSEQGYLDVANSPSAPTSNGVDARYAWTLTGGRSGEILIIDIEYDFRDGHEDLPTLASFVHMSGTRGVRPDDPLGDRNHGTAVLGVLRGVENGFGITGIAPLAALGFSAAFVFRPNPPRFVYDLPDAINRAGSNLIRGDILLIEQQTTGPTGTAACSASCLPCPPSPRSQFGSIPVEWEQATFDAIRSLTIIGRIVVEAGGNGQMNLGDARYNRAFDRTFRDSGAIIVGAGRSNSRVPMCFSSAGDRVDVQGWGENVTTLGYGDRFMGSAGETQWYTRIFNGTSSASPIVAGSAAAVNGVRRARGLQALSSIQMRGLLRTTGVAQATGRQIGPLPNLREAIALYVNFEHIGLALGTPAEPYRTLPDALANAWNDAHLKLEPGSYTVPSGVISQSVNLRATRAGIVNIAR